MRLGKVRAGIVAAAAVAIVGASPGSAQTGGQTGGQPTPYSYKKARFAEQSVKVKQLTAAAHMTKDDTAPARAFTAPTSMVADPDNPKVIAAATANLRNRTCYLIVSKDGGRTWRFSKNLPAPPAYPYCTNLNAGVPEVSIAWGRGGMLYYALQAYGDGEGPREGRSSIALARTTDLGETWRTTLVENNRGKTERPAPSASGVTGLAVDTSKARDVLYVGYSRSFPDAPSDSPLRNPHLQVATSTDGGVSFPPAVELNDFVKLTRNFGGRSYPLLMRSSFGAPFLFAHDGVVLAVAGSETPVNDRPAPPPEAGAGLTPGTFYAYPSPQLVARSTDQGKTWTVKELGPPIYGGTGSMTGMGWTSKGGRNGTIVAAYGATPETSPTTGLVDIVVQRSTDDGQTWSEPVAIDDDNPADQYSSIYPQLSVAPNGRIDVVWYDNRDQTDYLVNVRYSYSNDGGATWAPNIQVNDRPLDWKLGINFNSDLRHPPGVASTNQYAVFGWYDSRFANEVTQTQDVFGAMAQFSPLPATTNTAVPIAAAVFGGLVVAGLILLLVMLRRRRAQPATPPRVTPRQPVGAS
jgi:hypothetical protein